MVAAQYDFGLDMWSHIFIPGHLVQNDSGRAGEIIGYGDSWVKRELRM